MSFTAVRGRDAAQIVRIRRGRRRADGKKYCSDVCQRKGVLEWQRDHKKDIAKHLAKTSKSRSGASRRKRYVFTVCDLLRATSQQILALIIAGGSKVKSHSAYRILTGDITGIMINI